MKYKIIPRTDFCDEIEADNADEAMQEFALKMDTDMNLYFKAEEEKKKRRCKVDRFIYRNSSLCYGDRYSVQPVVQLKDTRFHKTITLGSFHDLKEAVMIRDKYDEYKRENLDLYRADPEDFIDKVLEMFSSFNNLKSNIKGYLDFPFNILPVIYPYSFNDKNISQDSKNIILSAIENLKDNQKRVLIGRFQNLRTLEDIGREMNITRERVRQIEVAALGNLRNSLRNIEEETVLVESLVSDISSLEEKKESLQKEIVYLEGQLSVLRKISYSINDEK